MNLKLDDYAPPTQSKASASKLCMPLVFTKPVTSAGIVAMQNYEKFLPDCTAPHTSPLASRTRRRTPRGRGAPLPSSPRCTRRRCSRGGEQGLIVNSDHSYHILEGGGPKLKFQFQCPKQKLWQIRKLAFLGKNSTSYNNFFSKLE